jgi:uncharacterized membrane protein
VRKNLTNGLTNGMMTAAALAAALLLLHAPADSQAPAGGKAPGDAKAPGKAGKGKGKGRPTGPTPHMADGKVDFSGVWNGGGPVTWPRDSCPEKRFR